MNGLRPDIVLLHPEVGVAVFEVKDWEIERNGYSRARDRTTGRWHVTISDAYRKQRIITRDPITQIRQYKQELADLYCPRISQQAYGIVLTAGLIFTRASVAKARSLLKPLLDQQSEADRYPGRYPIAGKDDIESSNIDAIFPAIRRKPNSLMTATIADDLRSWLREPHFSREQRDRITLDERQRELATTRTAVGYRRIRGPAGTGKSMVAAARAAILAEQGKRVLLITYNITLLNYLRDLTKRFAIDRKVLRRQITFLHFHQWCKRVLFDAGCDEDYDKLWWRNAKEEATVDSNVLDSALPKLTAETLASPTHRESVSQYDAIIVDEGQDMHLSWWQTLRGTLATDGEMMLLADRTQNIYGVDQSWTESAMTDAGFNGPWTRLRVCYRLPPDLAVVAAEYAERFLPAARIDVPKTLGMTDQPMLPYTFPIAMRWVQVADRNNGSTACAEAVSTMMVGLPEDTAVADIVLLANKAPGREIVAQLNSLGIRVHHTFQDVDKEARKQKIYFYKGSERVKATTIHSFKGWEARNLVIYIDRVISERDHVAVYTALTRVVRATEGSSLTVVTTCPELQRFGETWPSFSRV
jgi:hypothetical protein